MIQTNIVGTMRLTQHIVKIMIRHREGRIINMTSMATRVLAPGDAVYAATKSAIETWSQILNRELASYHVRVNCVAVSAYDGGMLNQFSDKTKRAIVDKIPHHTMTTLQDIIQSIDYLVLCQDVGGQTIHLGGC
jgi:3-oxoacyl-[acyl-carrier protein] reductase